jgi:hypothetical protein
MLISILEKGIEDHDMNIETNCGFINGRPLKIDVGPFKWDPKMKNPIDQYKILKRTAVRFQEWLQNHHPELCEHFETITEQTFHPEQETNLNEGI